MPLEVVDLIVSLSSWKAWGRTWSKVCKRYSKVDWLFGSLASGTYSVVPDMVPTINQAISMGRRLVFVRPGVYTESVRMTHDVIVCGLGAQGAARVRAPGWEPALVWGGFRAGCIQAPGLHLSAASGGIHAEVHSLLLTQRNQLQQIAVYITYGNPLLANCTIEGSIHVAGRGARPTLHECTVRGSRSCGIRFVDHASGCALSSCS